MTAIPISVSTGLVSESEIVALVDAFYEKVRKDGVLAPVFDRAIGDRWDEHLEKMYAFWSSVMLTSGRYKGNPLVVHRQVEGIQAEMFGRWLELFGETCDGMFPPETAAVFKTKAGRIAESLKAGVFGCPAARLLKPAL